MAVYLAVCAGLSTLCLLIATVFLVVTLVELRKASAALQEFVERLEDKLDVLHAAVDALKGLPNELREAASRGGHMAAGILHGIRDAFFKPAPGRDDA